MSELEKTIDAEPTPDADDLEQLLLEGDSTSVQRFLKVLHPADLAILFAQIDHDYWPRVVKNLSIGEISDLMEELDEHLRDDLVELLRHDQLVRALGQMHSDDAADVIADLPQPIAEAVLQDIPAKDRIEVETLMRYPEDSAGGLMQIELVSVRKDVTAQKAVEAIRANAGEVGNVHFVYVVDEKQKLYGLLPLDRLILALPDKQINDLVETEFFSVVPEMDQEDVARMFQRYDLVSLAVVDEQNRLLGRITHDDIIDVLEEEHEEDILRMAGAEEPELIYTNRVFKIASVRLPWLLCTIGGGLLSGWFLWQFKVSFPQLLALITFVPVIAAMGGNIGTQSSTIVVRGFATGRIDYHSLGRFLWRELAIGLIMGVVCGLVLGLVGSLWHENNMLGLAAGISMALAIAASAVMGVAVPFLFRLIRVDPAIAAGPLVTTANDLLGIVLYYLVALILIA